MNRRSSRAIKCALVLAAPLVVALPGCPSLLPTAVVEGTWALTAQNAPNLNELLITFNSTGRVTHVTYQLAGGSVISVNAPVGTVTVSGKNVSVNTTFNGNSLTFNGTLNSANTVITGSITTHIVVGAVTVTINNGPATLTKQTEN